MIKFIKLYFVEKIKQLFATLFDYFLIIILQDWFEKNVYVLLWLVHNLFDYFWTW